MTITQHAPHENTSCDELLHKVLNGEIEYISQKDLLSLIKNKQPIIKYLHSLFANEIDLLVGKEKCSNPTSLYWGLKLAGLLQALELSPWIEKLCSLEIEQIDDALGEYFVTDEFPYLLADTLHDWNVLKKIIENSDLDEYILRAYLEALTLFVAKNRVDRLEITDYFKSLFNRILDGELDDDYLCTPLIAACSDFWPGECLEEIRESFGLNLVDQSEIELADVLHAFSKGEETCLKNLKERILANSYLEAPSDIVESLNPNPSDDLDKLSKKLEKATQAIEQPKRNDPCTCGSGRKYKKCCLNNPLSNPLSSNLQIEESTISHLPLTNLDGMETLSEFEKDSILDFYHLVKENPKEALDQIPPYIKKYPLVPCLYNYLFIAYRSLELNREAISILKKSFELFPDYLFARVEYALYLLRRGEVEKAEGALGNAMTLTQLYPERKIFHISEYKSFAYVIGCICVEKNDLNQAQIYLQFLQKICPRTIQVDDLKKKIRAATFCNYLEREFV